MTESASSYGKIDPRRCQRSSRPLIWAIILCTALFLFLWWTGTLPHPGEPNSHVAAEADYVPPLWAVTPFLVLLGCIAVLPLIGGAKKWWEHNLNRFLVAAVLAGVTLAFYGLLHPGGVANHFTHQTATSPGLETVYATFSNGIFMEFVPFIALLFSLFVISGGISLTGDLPAHPITNSSFIAAGGFLASLIGTTGAAMVLIRPLLATNSERKRKVHTVIFFIFVVCNCGGLLLPIGDPPLFLGYLRGVPFTWTLRLWPYWLAVNLSLLLIYYVWDRRAYRREAIEDIVRDETTIRPLRLIGKTNFLCLMLVVFAVALVVPGATLPGTDWTVPYFLREVLMLWIVVLSLKWTPFEARDANNFDYDAILEVAALFSGIFLTMQVPLEILRSQGADLGISSPGSFFWVTGALSSFLDNAPTYVVFFETAASITPPGATEVIHLTAGKSILEVYLTPISLGAVLMGANTYIGNGPNFMVKSIAERAGVRMPTFFGYTLYSAGVLIPLFLILTAVL